MGKQKSNSKKVKNKKGPKGKKARAKAKLDRQWGIMADDDDDDSRPVLRQGPSRLLRTRDSKKKKKKNQSNNTDDEATPLTKADDNNVHKKNNVHHHHPLQPQQDQEQFDDDSDYSDDDSDDSTSNNNNNSAAAATVLLNSISSTARKKKRRPNNKRRQQPTTTTLDDDDDDDDDSVVSSSEEEGDDDASLSEKNDMMELDDGDNNDEEDDDDDDDNVNVLQSQNLKNHLPDDPFTTRFSSIKDPLPADGQHQRPQQRLIKLPPKSTDSNKSLIPPSKKLIIELSESLLLASVLDTKDDDNNDRKIIVLAKKYANCYRQVLQPHLLKSVLLFGCSNKKNKKSSRINNNNHPIILPWLFAVPLTQYADLLLITAASTTTTTNGSTRTKQQEHEHDDSSWQTCVQLHILNHILTSRHRISKHNQKLAAAAASPEHDDDDDDDDNDDDGSGGEEQRHPIPLEPPRDQGYTRPTVLVLLPTRHTCFDFVRSLQGLLEIPKQQQQQQSDKNNKNTKYEQHQQEQQERFAAEFGPPPPPPSDNNSKMDGEDDDDAERRRKEVLKQKGREWNELFGDDRNDDDDFKVGIQFNNSSGSSNKRAPTMKLYTDFYKSDMIVASPLALKLLDDTINDVLSSIEICVIPQAHVHLYQNWDHVNDVLRCLNQQLQNTTDHTDFSRVRQYLLAGQACHWRQLIVTTKFMDPAIQHSFKAFAQSISGQVRVRRKYNDDEDASISSILLPTRQVFQKVPCPHFSQAGEHRVDYFFDKILPKIRQEDHTMIFIPSYFDFVALRNRLLKNEDDADFVNITEYSRPSEVTRGRARFLQGRQRFLLYTGRAHFFHRHYIKGVRNIIFLGIPEEATFYSELINRLEQPNNDKDNPKDNTCLVLFTKYESHALERVVGTSHCHRMIKSDKSTFVFS